MCRKELLSVKRGDLLIKKAREIPVKILKLEALLRRLALNHQRRKKIGEELAKSYAGYRGE